MKTKQDDLAAFLERIIVRSNPNKTLLDVHKHIINTVANDVYFIVFMNEDSNTQEVMSELVTQFEKQYDHIYTLIESNLSNTEPTKLVLNDYIFETPDIEDFKLNIGSSS